MQMKRLCVAGLRAGLLSSASLLIVSTAFAQEAPTTPAPAQPATVVAPADDATPPEATSPDQAGAAAAGTPAAAPAAQTAANEDPSDVQEIVVTGTRLSVSGYQQPTPVTVVGAEKLERDAEMDLASVITDLPSVGPSQSTNSGLGTQSISSNTAGLALINLRSLGTARTLTLFNGVRVAPSAENGGVDLNLLPSTLVERIDVVTGGASAAWGSDAVSGVVNVILNKKFDGIAAHIEGATNQKGTRQQLKGELSFGTDVTERGHLILSGSYLYSPDRVIPSETDWYKSQGLVLNPAFTPTNSEPRLIHAERVGMANATQGGLITSGPLRGIQFVENGRPVPFDFGNVSGTLSNGGTFADPILQGQAQNLTIPLRSGQLFGHFSYDLGSDITASLEINYGKAKTRNSGPSFTRNNNVLIRADNPFLDAGLAAQMQARGIASFNLSTTNTNNVDIAGGDEPTALAVGNWNAEGERTLFRQVLSFEGPLKLFADWDWNVDFQHSKVHRYTYINGNPITARYNQAIDAVRVTPANVGTSGLPIGTIACRSSLTAPNGCVPLNVLGINVADPAAIAYVQGRSDGTGSFSDLWFEQYTASAAMRGEPFSTWAGPVDVAFGVDYRDDSIRQTADPLQYARAYTISNRQKFDASQDSIEGFGEINVPLINEGFVDSFDLNAAVRWTNYSTSGEVVTWKVGAVSQLNEHIRVRATASRDIRAPTLVGLFEPGASQQQVVLDPVTNTATSITTIIAGNPNLDPEVARTYTAGIVLTPQFLPGLSASVDYYKIRIKDAFVTPLADQVVRECRDGNPNFCALVQRDPSTNALTGLLVGPVNAAFEKTAGIDFQVDYRMPAFDGRLDFSVLGNLITELAIDALGTVRRPLNSLNRTLEGPNKFRSTISASYTGDRFSTGLQARVIGAGKLNTLAGPKDIDDNSVPAVAYLDARASYFLDADRKFQAYLAVDNLLGRKPPIIPNDPLGSFAYFFVPTRTELYDFLGRQFRVGLRAKF